MIFLNPAGLIPVQSFRKLVLRFISASAVLVISCLSASADPGNFDKINLVAISDAVAVLRIDSVEGCRIKIGDETYDRKAIAHIEQVLKGTLSREITICSRLSKFECPPPYYIETGRSLVFLRDLGVQGKSGRVWTCTDSMYGSQKIEKDRVSWWDDKTSVPLSDVVKDIKAVVATKPVNIFAELAKNSTEPRVYGNIAPYQKSVLIRIAGNWKKSKTARTGKQGSAIVEINKAGILKSRKIGESCDTVADDELLKAIDASKFEPLPDWYKGSLLTLKIRIAKLDELCQGDQNRSAK